MSNKDSVVGRRTIAFSVVFLWYTTFFNNVGIVAQGQTTRAVALSSSTTTTASTTSRSSSSSGSSVAGAGSPSTDDLSENSNHERHDELFSKRRELLEAGPKDYTDLGEGLCEGDFEKIYSDWYSTSQLSVNSANGAFICFVGHCNNEEFDLTGYAFNVKWSGNTKYQYVCYCHKDNAVTASRSSVSDPSRCYAYNKGDQLVGTNYEPFFYFVGQGRCIGSDNKKVFGSTSHSGKQTDNDCAEQCSSSFAFSRKLDDNTCYCHTETTGKGDLTASDDNNYNCYGKRELEISSIDEGGDFSYLGTGGCNTAGGSPEEKTTTYEATIHLDHEDCINKCGDGVTGIAVKSEEEPNHGIQYRLRCYCYKNNAVTGADGSDSDSSCYAYNKGYQLAGTSSESRFYFVGQGRCIGSENSKVFGYTSHPGKQTDNDCAEQCSSSFAFSRSRLYNFCHCHTESTGKGDLAASDDDSYNCYGNREFLTSSIAEEFQAVSAHSDYTNIGEGVCENGGDDDEEETTDWYAFTTGFDSNHAFDLCYSPCDAGELDLTGISVNVELKVMSDGVLYYRVHCYCHKDNAVTGASGSDSLSSCYAYNKGDQLVGTNYESSFYYAGKGVCIGSVNGEVYDFSVTNEIKTDNDCAEQCSSNFAFSRNLIVNICICYSETKGTGDVIASYKFDWANCYSKIMNRIDGTSGFVYDDWGEYPDTGPGRVHVGVTDTDAECAKTCLDKSSAGEIGEIEGITKNKETGDCYCSFGRTQPVGDKIFTSYKLLPSARVFNCPPNSALSTTLDDGKTRLEAVCDCNGGGKKSLSILDSETCDCPTKTDSWCDDNELDRYELKFDCDSDGNFDSLCVSQNGYTMLKSQSACNEVSGTSVIDDCPAANYGNQDLGEWASQYFWRGIGPCRGSYANPTQEQFSHFEIEDEMKSDEECAEACDLMDLTKQNIVSFSRRVYLNKCYCQFQKNTADFDVDYDGEGAGAVAEGTDHRFSCYGRYLSGNQIIDSTTKFLVNDGRTRFELKGLGPCRDGVYQPFPHFQVENHPTAENDDECMENCLAVFDGIVGIARHQTSGQCHCHYDAVSTLPDSESITKVRAKSGTGEVLGGWLPDFACVGRVEGRSGFDFIGSGGCSDNADNLFPHVRVSNLAHSDASCAKLCLEALPQVLTGFTRNQKDLSCYCAYSTGATLPDPYNSDTTNYPRLWENEGGTGAVVAVKYRIEEQITPLLKRKLFLNGYSCYAVDSTSHVTNCPDNSNLATELDTDGLKILESWCDCDSGNGKDVFDAGDTCNCARPYRWCTNPGDEYVYLDCDGDGTTDSLCTSSDGNILTLQSSNACHEQEGEDVSATCSAKVDGCSKSDSWCNGAGDEYSFLDCDGDGAKDSVCKESDGSYVIALSSNNCVDENSAASDVVCPAVNACVRNDTWCTERDQGYFFIDCDRDGALDSLCKTSNTTYLLQLSSDNCVETSADNSTLADLCPASGCIRPAIWCGHPGSQYYYVDCDDDGVMDSHCRDEDGYTWTILSGSGYCKRTRERCPAADFCTHRDDWCNHAGSHFYWTNPNGEYGNDDSRCILDIGTQWKDTNCYRNLTEVHQEREYILSRS